MLCKGHGLYAVPTRRTSGGHAGWKVSTQRFCFSSSSSACLEPFSDRERAQILPRTMPRDVAVDYKDQAAFGSIALDAFGTKSFSARK